MQSCLPGDSRVVRPVLRQINSDGAVVTLVEGLLLDEECDYLIKKAGKMRQSETNGDDGDGVVDNYRTSRTAYLPEDAVVGCLGRRLATIANMPAENIEPLQVTAYKNKQR